MNNCMQIMTFRFIPIEYEEKETSITALVQYPEDRDVKELRDKIEDCIVSYIDTVEAWTFEGLVHDVLGSFADISFTIPEPSVFNI